MRVFMASGGLTPKQVSSLVPLFERNIYTLSETSKVNAFTREVTKTGDYYAQIAVESPSLRQALLFGESVDKKQRVLAHKQEKTFSDAFHRTGCERT